MGKSPVPTKGQPTLFSFFQKTPQGKPVKKDLPSSPLVPKEVKKEPTQLSTPEPSSQPVSSPDTALASMPSRDVIASSPVRVGRRNKRFVVDSDSEDDAAADDAEESDNDWGIKESSDEDIPISRPLKKEKRLKTSSGSSNIPSSNIPSSGIPSSGIPSSGVPSSEVAVAALDKFAIGSDYHCDPLSVDAKHRVLPTKKIKVSEDPERYKWLLDIRDADGHRPDDPDYDPRTVLVPKSAWTQFTPFEKQYWEVKQNLWNTVVFFKKGKFYELYENDAEIAHREFDLKLAGGGRANMALCGVPEMSFDYWASAFIAKGYKVARVDQAETALGKEMRDIANKKKEEKIIRRELSCVLTGGTLTDATMLVSDLSQYCMAITQDELEFAACFVDTSTSQFYLAHFTDKSTDYPMLETLMAQTRPKEIVVPRGKIDKFALKIMKNNTSVDTLWETVKPGAEFWDADTTRHEVTAGEYFSDEELPKILNEALESDLATSAVGGLLWYLRTLKLDKQLLSLGQFSKYDASATANGSTMVLDGQTLQNLEIFANTWDGGSEGTLFRLINKCTTPLGKRRLRSWISHPLQRPEDIGKRADAVDMFMQQTEIATTLADRLVGLPDTERMISRVHANSLRPKDFVRLVAGLEKIARLLNWLNGLKSQLPQLTPFLTTDTDIEQLIDPWMTCFDHLEAKTNDTLVPEPGVDPDFDATKSRISKVEGELQEVMKRYRREMFKSNSIEYRDSGKEIYLIEVPVKLVKLVPRDWQQMGATAKFKRFWSPEVRQLVRALQEAQEYHKTTSQVVQEKMYRQFCSPENYEIFMTASKTISAIDCLLSLARTSEAMAVHCRPEIAPLDEKPVLQFSELRHPVATSTSFIPNDVHLGGDVPRMSLLTGANAAGKSTVLRTTSCAILLAQMGCHVPANSARLTPVDRIMTRLGASDNIFAGKSTFHLELSETERILSEASARSLVVIDELGRGGSSGDGFAIAESVLHHLATHIGCRGFFATHYATLYDSFETHPQVKPERMAIEVDKHSREVTFLYKLEPGRSEGSFGMNVAAMCGVSAEIVANAERAANEYEHTSMLKKQAEMHSNDVPLGLQSDVVNSLKEIFSDEAVEIMRAMALKCST